MDSVNYDCCLLGVIEFDETHNWSDVMAEVELGVLSSFLEFYPSVALKRSKNMSNFAFTAIKWKPFDQNSLSSILGYNERLIAKYVLNARDDFRTFSLGRLRLTQLLKLRLNVLLGGDWDLLLRLLKIL